MSKIQGANTEWTQELLNTYFADEHIAVDDVQKIEGHSHIIDWPRQLFCDCKRCRSPYAEKVSLGTTIILTAATGTYTAYRPNPDKDVLKHDR